MGGEDTPRLFAGFRCFLLLLLLLVLCFYSRAGRAQAQSGPSVVSGLILPRTTLHPYDWTYLRVELPPSFASMVLNFASDINIDKERMEGLPMSKLPVICFKDGSPPLPDVLYTYTKDSLVNFQFNGSFGGLQDPNVLEQCIPFLKNITVTLTSEQISPGVWYIGFFNGLGPARMQSKMINRGQVYMFSIRINVEKCSTSTLLGPYCNQKIDMISCSQYVVSNHARTLLDGKSFTEAGSLNHMMSGASNYLPSSLNTAQDMQVLSNSSMFMMAENLISCNNSIDSSCLGYGELRFYFVDILSVTPQFNIMATELRLNGTSSVGNSANFNRTLLMCYARYNKLPLNNLYDHSADISKAPLIVKSPKIGRWYIAVQSVNHTDPNGVVPEANPQANLCFSFQWQVHECLDGKAGLNCSWESYMLQRVARKGSSIPFESYYVPIDDDGSVENNEFHLERFLSNSSVDGVAWTYFFVNVPPGAAGVLHVLLISDKIVNYELYSKYGGMPSIDSWDYYANSTSSSNRSMFLVLDENSRQKINFYILYPKEGTWCFGLKHSNDSRDGYQTTMSVSVEGCPRHCSSNGGCHYSIDLSGLAFYSFCSCDRDHGGFDCSDELVSWKGHVWHSIFLIASNAAAIFPAFWALRQKAFAEWVLFTSSGISSGLYHACDVGTWCVLSFRVLQFMDFWLSFMAVVSTFIFMSTIDEVSKRAIHTCVAIFTALLAVTGATRSANIILVIAIGTLALLIAWLLEFSTANRSLFSPSVFDLNIAERWENIKGWFFSLIKILKKRFRWGFVLLGFIALAAAAVSWKLETKDNYWIWHSLWHVTIYTSSFFFLYSTSSKSCDENQEPTYELARQNSSRNE